MRACQASGQIEACPPYQMSIPYEGVYEAVRILALTRQKDIDIILTMLPGKEAAAAEHVFTYGRRNAYAKSMDCWFCRADRYGDQ